MRIFRNVLSLDERRALVAELDAQEWMVLVERRPPRRPPRSIAFLLSNELVSILTAIAGAVHRDALIHNYAVGASLHAHGDSETTLVVLLRAPERGGYLYVEGRRPSLAEGDAVLIPAYAIHHVTRVRKGRRVSLIVDKRPQPGRSSVTGDADGLLEVI